MIEIKRTTDKKIMSDFSVVAHDNTVVMAATEKDECFGIGVATIKNDYSILEKIEMKDEFKMFEMDFGMGKSLLNLIDLSGIRYVFSDIDDKRLMTALRFKENAELPEGIVTDKEYKYFLCLDGYFTLHKCDGE